MLGHRGHLNCEERGGVTCRQGNLRQSALKTGQDSVRVHPPSILRQRPFFNTKKVYTATPNMQTWKKYGADCAILHIRQCAAAVALVDCLRLGVSRWRGVGGLAVGWWVTLGFGCLSGADRCLDVWIASSVCSERSFGGLLWSFGWLVEVLLGGYAEHFAA
jgi:hypothetical protein